MTHLRDLQGTLGVVALLLLWGGLDNLNGKHPTTIGWGQCWGAAGLTVLIGLLEVAALLRPGQRHRRVSQRGLVSFDVPPAKGATPEQFRSASGGIPEDDF